MKEIKTSVTTDKQKFDNAMELLEKSSKLFDMASKVFSEIGIELYRSSRPIEFYGNDPLKANIHIYTGVKAIAEINGTEVVTGGAPYFAVGDERYISTDANGINFHELV